VFKLKYDAERIGKILSDIEMYFDDLDRLSIKSKGDIHYFE